MQETTETRDKLANAINTLRSSGRDSEISGLVSAYKQKYQTKAPIQPEQPGLLRRFAGGLVKAPEQVGRTATAGLEAVGRTVLGNVFAPNSQSGQNTLGQNYQQNLNKLGADVQSLSGIIGGSDNNAVAQDVSTVQGALNTGADVLETATYAASGPAAAATRLGRVAQLGALGAKTGTAVGVADVMRDEDRDILGSVGTIGANILGGTLLGGGLGLASKGTQVGVEAGLKTNTIDNLAQKLGVKKGAVAEAAYNNQFVRQTGKKLDSQGNVAPEALQEVYDTGIKKIKTDITKTLTEKRFGENGKKIRESIEKASPETIETMAKILETNPIDSKSQKFILDKPLNALKPQLNKSGVNLKDSAIALSDSGVQGESALLKKVLLQELKKTPGLKEVDLDDIIKNDLLEPFMQTYSIGKKGKQFDFNNLNKALQDGNLISLDANGKQDVISKALANVVRDIVRRDSLNIRKNLTTPSQQSLFDNYALELDNYASLKTIENYFTLLSNTATPKLNFLTKLAANTLATGGTYNPILFVGSEAIVDGVGNRIIKRGSERLGQTNTSSRVMTNKAQQTSQKTQEAIDLLKKETTAKKLKDKLKRAQEKEDKTIELTDRNRYSPFPVTPQEIAKKKANDSQFKTIKF